MDVQSGSNLVRRPFDEAETVFAGLSAEEAGLFAALASDVVLLLDENGAITDLAYQDDDLSAWEPETWIGRKFSEIVTSECVEKIDALLAEAGKKSVTRQRQVNHAAPGRNDLPVSYRLVSLKGLPAQLALGQDLRPMADMQRRLVATQMELETEYRKIREAESRYRTIFQKSAQPIIVTSGDRGQIIDMNMAACTLLSVTRNRAMGEPLASLFDREAREDLGEAVKAVRFSGSIRTLTARANNGSTLLEMAMEPYRENGQTNILLTITGRDGKKSVESGGDSDTLLQALPEAAIRIDSRGIILDANDQFLDLVHVLNKSAIVSRNLNNWLGGSGVDMQVLLSRLRDETQIRQFSSVVRDELGESQPVAVSAARLHGENEDQIVVIVTDNGRREASLSLPAPGRAGANGTEADFAELVGRVPLKDVIREAADVIEKMCIEAALRQTDNNRASAADMLGLSRQSLYIKLRRHNLEDFDVKSP